MTARHTLPLIALACLLAGACSTRQGSGQGSYQSSSPDLVRLTHQVESLSRENAALRDERDILAREVGGLREDNAALKAQLTRGGGHSGSSHAIGHGRAHATGRAAAPAGPAQGDWVVVLASVGQGHAATQRPAFDDLASQLNRRYGGEHGQLFAVRTPRSGGLQVVYGGRDGGFGLPKGEAEAFLARLKRDGQYRDALLLNVR